MSKQVKAVEGEVIPANAIVGYDLRNAADQAEQAVMARQKFSRSGKTRIIQGGEVDFGALGADVADMVMGIESEAQQAIKEIRKQWRVSKGTAWLAAAMELPKASDPQEALTTLVDAFGLRMEAKGHKRAKVDKSEFRLFCLAYLVSPTEVFGVLEDHETDAEAMKELRAIRDTGKRPSDKAKTKSKRKPTDKQMSAIIAAVGGMDVKQLTMLYKAGKSRAAVLRKKGELFEAFR